MNPTKKNHRWFTEWFTPHESHSHELKKIIVQKKTKYQDALIADTYSFGRCLLLDGEMQSAQLDEHIYHESLVHPCFITHPSPQRIAILGGGEGATLREILKHGTVRKTQMIDIDGEVVDFCKQHMRRWHQGSFNHPKAEVIIDDARKFILQTTEQFDVILSDLPSPLESGPASQLYTVEFYRILKKRLARNGLFVLQAGSGNLIQIELHLKLYRTLKSVFPIVRSYSAYIPSFDVPWSFLVCAQDPQLDPLALSAGEVDRRIKKRVRGPLNFYDGMTHEGLFRIPKHLRTFLSREKGVITVKKPVYFSR